MRSTFRLTVYQSGTMTRRPVEINEPTLEEALLMASLFDGIKVKAILDCAKRIGVAEYTEGEDRPVYVVERLDGVEVVPSPAQPKSVNRHIPDKPIWQLSWPQLL